MMYRVVTLAALVLFPGLAVAQRIDNPLVAGTRAVPMGPDIKVDPAKMPGARRVDGVLVDPFISSTMVDLALQQRAQEQAQQAEMLARQQAEARAYLAIQAQLQEQERLQRQREYELCIKERESLFGRSRDLLLAASGTRPPECKF